MPFMCNDFFDVYCLIIWSLGEVLKQLTAAQILRIDRKTNTFYIHVRCASHRSRSRPSESLR